MNPNNDYYYMLALLANLMQIADFQMNVTQLSNDDLMKHLLQQDKVLDEQNNVLQEQTNIYLKTIVKQNEEIIKLLKGGNNA